MKKMFFAIFCSFCFSSLLLDAASKEEDALLPIASCALNVKKLLKRLKIGYLMVERMGMFPPGFSGIEKTIIRYWLKDPANLKKLVRYAQKNGWPQEYVEALKILGDSYQRALN